MLIAGSEAIKRREIFFDSIFKGMEGKLCLTYIKPNQKGMHEEFFDWPGQKAFVLDFADRWSMHANVYFCVNLLSKSERKKQYALDTKVLWADLDACPPEKCEIEPNVVLETSPNRFQALWVLEEPINPYDAEDMCRRIAYKYERYGCDKTGWDITQLLRVPFTINHKYGGELRTGPQVLVVTTGKMTHAFEEFEALFPQVADFKAGDIPLPDPDDLPTQTAEELMEMHHNRLQPLAFHLYMEEPTVKSWSESLWQLELFCVEAGMSREETFVVAQSAACNKYKRDGRDVKFLWKDVCRAWLKFESHLQVLKPSAMQPLLSDEERAKAEAHKTFIDDYIEWAKTVGDAAPQYHQAGAFIILSALLAGPIRLPTSFGIIIPNLWFLILADTTLTRKTTAMDLAMDIVTEVDSDALMATDGSIEGLFKALQFRPGRPSVFLRDEFSGLIEQMTKKDYYAGMAETLTKLYDGKYSKRLLSRDTVEIKNPVLLVFGGGIRDRILSLLHYEHVASGFVPRFIFITADSDLSRIRPLGPPTSSTMEGRNELVQQMTILHSHYTAPQMVKVKDQILSAPALWEAQLTPASWNLYNYYENRMMEASLKAKMPELITPMFDRLCKSGLKAAVLLASLRMEPQLIVNVDDLQKAFYYVEYWRECALEVIENIGHTANEKQVQQISRHIKKSADGVTRSELMQMYHLDARVAESVLMTLEQRGDITRRKSGRTEWLHANIIPNQ